MRATLTGWTMASFRAEEATKCAMCRQDLTGLTVLRHPKFGVVCSETCAEELQLRSPEEEQTR